MPTLRAVTYASVTVSLYARLVAAAISVLSVLTLVLLPGLPDEADSAD